MSRRKNRNNNKSRQASQPPVATKDTKVTVKETAIQKPEGGQTVELEDWPNYDEIVKVLGADKAKAICTKVHYMGADSYRESKANNDEVPPQADAWIHEAENLVLAWMDAKNPKPASKEQPKPAAKAKPAAAKSEEEVLEYINVDEVLPSVRKLLGITPEMIQEKGVTLFPINEMPDAEAFDELYDDSVINSVYYIGLVPDEEEVEEN